MSCFLTHSVRRLSHSCTDCVRQGSGPHGKVRFGVETPSSQRRRLPPTAAASRGMLATAWLSCLGMFVCTKVYTVRMDILSLYISVNCFFHCFRSQTVVQCPKRTCRTTERRHRCNTNTLELIYNNIAIICAKATLCKAQDFFIRSAVLHTRVISWY